MVLSEIAGFPLFYSSFHSPLIEPLLGTKYKGYPAGSSGSLKFQGGTHKESILIHYLFTER